MSREESYLKVFEATALIQQHISVILQAKAAEARKTRNWLCHHMVEVAYSSQSDQQEEPYKFHDNIIETIDAITKVELGLAANLKILFNQDEESSDGGDSLSDGFDASSFSDLFGTDGDD